jgi:hypothetical protein
MNNNVLHNRIREINFPPRGKKLIRDLESAYKLIDSQITNGKQKLLLKEDFNLFIKTGRYIVKKTFTGGIIFLREPETILGITIKFHTTLNKAIASVEYASEKRNARNVKYKPNAGKIEHLDWNMMGVFPHFYLYDKDIKIALMMIIGQITQQNCEIYRRDSWFMRFEKEFDIQIFLDHKLELNYPVKILEKNPNKTDFRVENTD